MKVLHDQLIMRTVGNGKCCGYDIAKVSMLRDVDEEEKRKMTLLFTSRVRI